MTMPTPLCPYPMQVHSLRQETPDVWTIALINHDFYPYLSGQHALVSIDNRDDLLRAYTLSSSPGLSRFITLTVRRLDGGVGSGWLTGRLRPGNTLWLSEAQGEFNCRHAVDDRYLMLAAGCGVTPIMSMCRWLLANRPEADISVIYSVREPQQTIFADEWRSLTQRHPDRLRLTLIAEHNATAEFSAGRIGRELLLERVPDVARRTVMTCGPAPYMRQVENLCRQAGVPAERFFEERFRAEEEATGSEKQLTLTAGRPPRRLQPPVGVSLLAALEMHKIPVTAACRAGVCGSCKTRIASGDYTTSSTMTLTEKEIADGYVLACSCQLQGDTVLA